MRNIFTKSSNISPLEKHLLMNQWPVTFWLTGLSGSGKSTLAFELEDRLNSLKIKSVVLDGDNLRYRLNKDLDFSKQGRSENLRRTAEVAKLFNDTGMVVIASLISPYETDRTIAKEIIGSDRYVEIYLKASIHTCEQRDTKGIYAKAKQGIIPDFTGISSQYEIPSNPDLVLDSENLLPSALVNQIINSYYSKMKLEN